MSFLRDARGFEVLNLLFFKETCRTSFLRVKVSIYMLLFYFLISFFMKSVRQKSFPLVYFFITYNFSCRLCLMTSLWMHIHEINCDFETLIINSRRKTHIRDYCIFYFILFACNLALTSDDGKRILVENCWKNYRILSSSFQDTIHTHAT